MKQLIDRKKLLIIILLAASLLRLFRLGYPDAYVFDEVYHAFTAKEYLIGNPNAWVWWTTPPPGVAFEWTHPPLGKEIMTASMWLLHSTNAWAWRLPGALLGILSVYLVYLVAKELFKKESVALLSAYLFSIDGLNFVQSRTGMIDIYFVAAMLLTLWLLLKNKFFLASLGLGISVASKWTAFYLFGMVYLLVIKKKAWQYLPFFIFIPPAIYLLSYLPFFTSGHTFDQLVELQRQMWWYHTNLKATHDYSSPWWMWPLNLKPVWYYVEYSGNNMANIFAGGNPLLFWSGAVAILLTTWEFINGFILKLNHIKEKINTQLEPLFITLLGYFIFWLPWALSPRIMFLYHYAPSIPFLAIALGYQLDQLLPSKKNHKLLILILGAITLSFVYVFPFLTGIMLPKDLVNLFFLTNITKNPFK